LPHFYPPPSDDSDFSDPVELIVAVVKIDDVAVENWRNDKAVNGVPLKNKAQHFADQIERYLKVFPVSAPQYRLLCANESALQAFL
jgi:hypothetical protein